MAEDILMPKLSDTMEEGRIIGIITRSDAMLYFYDLLPD